MPPEIEKYKESKLPPEREVTEKEKVLVLMTGARTEIERKEGGIFKFFKNLGERKKTQEQKEIKEEFDKKIMLKETKLLFSERILGNPLARKLSQLFNVMTLYFILGSPMELHKAYNEQQTFIAYLQEAGSQQKENKEAPPFSKWIEGFLETKDIIQQAGVQIKKEEEEKNKSTIHHEKPKRTD